MWKYLWNAREISPETTFSHNGYAFETDEKYQRFIQQVCMHLPLHHGDAVLDVGCGNGSFFHHLCQQRKVTTVRLDGFDFCTKSIQYAKEHYVGTFREGDAGEVLPFKDDSFDVLVCVCVLQYLPNKDKSLDLLREIKRVVKPSGSILLGNCLDQDKRELANRLREGGDYLPGNLQYLTKQDILGIFPTAQFVDAIDMDLDFYDGQEYKFSAYVTPCLGVGVEK